MHHVVVSTNATGIVVTMDGDPGAFLRDRLPSQVLVGFTAATGGFNDIHQVQNVNITTGPPPPAPTVTGVSPSSGPTTGGTPVTITGTALDGRPQREVRQHGGHRVHGEQRHLHHGHRPGGQGRHRGRDRHHRRRHERRQRARPVHLRRPAAASPTVTIVNPNSGPAGTSVTVSGTNFTGVTEVDFGSGNKASFTVNNSTTLTATAPAGSGTVDVTVTTASGTSKTLTDDQFTYAAGPPPGTIPSPVAGGWQLNGTAVLNTTASPANLQLTPATNWQSGSAFYPTPVAGAGITASFDMFIGSSNSNSGADGLTFTLADASVTKPTALGDNGGGEGFSGITRDRRVLRHVEELRTTRRTTSWASPPPTPPSRA